MLKEFSTKKTSKTQETIRDIPLLSAISIKAPKQDESGSILCPAPEVFTLLTQSAREEILAIRSLIGSSSKQEAKIRSLKSTKVQTEQDKQKLVAESAQALAVESNYFNSEIAKRDELLQKTSKELTLHTEPLNKIQTLGRELRDIGRKELDSFIAKYPDAQLIDLNCMSYFKLNNGLPALTLFSVEMPFVRFHISNKPEAILQAGSLQYGSLSYTKNNLIDGIIPGLGISLGKQICIATGVAYTDQRGKPQFAKDFPETEQNQRPSASANSITLIADFASLGGSIPAHARKIINEAKASKEFESILLLAEVRKWQVEYEELTGTPKIEGISKPKPKTEDPLIIGIKKIWNRKFPFLLGHFDTTPLEKLLKDEFCIKPD